MHQKRCCLNLKYETDFIIVYRQGSLEVWLSVTLLKNSFLIGCHFDVSAVMLLLVGCLIHCPGSPKVLASNCWPLTVFIRWLLHSEEIAKNFAVQEEYPNMPKFAMCTCYDFDLLWKQKFVVYRFRFPWRLEFCESQHSCLKTVVSNLTFSMPCGHA